MLQGFRSIPRLAAIQFAVCLSISSVRAEGIPEPSLIWYGQVRNNAAGENVRLVSGTLSWTLRLEGGGVVQVLSVPLTNLIDQFSYVVEVRCESEVGGGVPSPGVLRLARPPLRYQRGSVTLNGQPVFLSNTNLETFILDGQARGRVERLDLGLVRVDPDRDGDGLPDWWESQFPGGDVLPGADFDGDGVSNRDEYRAGTGAMDPQSLFQIAISKQDAGYPVVVWGSAVGKMYRLFRATSLISPPGGFEEIYRFIGATPPVNQFVDWSATGEGPYFYLLQVEE